MPFIIETSAGLTRSVLMVLSDAYEEEEVAEGDTRVVMRFHPEIAPITVGVFPLVKKDGLAELAQEIETEPARRFLDLLRPERRHRPALPPAGRSGNPVLHHRRLPDQGRPDRHAPLPRFHGAGPREDRRARAEDPEGDQSVPESGAGGWRDRTESARSRRLSSETGLPPAVHRSRGAFRALERGR